MNFDNSIFDTWQGVNTIQKPMQLDLPIFNDPDRDPKSEVSPLCPGSYIKLELEKRSWGQAALAEILSKPVAAVNQFITGKRPLTAEMAVALGRAFDQPAELWAHREAAYRLSLVKDSPDEETTRKARLFETAPIREMQQRGWISPTAQTADEIERELAAFMRTDVLATARQKTGEIEFSTAQRAWLCRAASIATRVNARRFSVEKLAAGMDRIRKLATMPEKAAHAPIMLAEMGIRLVIIEGLPRTKIDGAAFFLGNDPDKPVIALTLRVDRMESVWHTLGHELQHIMRGDPLSIDADFVGKDRVTQHDDMEKAADLNSANWLIPRDQIESLILRIKPLFPRERIIQFANRMAIHPSIVVGQLHHLGAIGWEKHNDLCPKVRDHFLLTTTSDGFSK